MTDTTDNNINLEQPIQRGEHPIATVALRRPLAGELRGIKLADVLQLDVTAMIELLPRITEPALHKHELNAMDPADLSAMSLKVIGFFVQKSALQSPAE